MRENGSIESITYYPSPNPNVILKEIVYWSKGLRIKGMLAMPKKEGNYEGLLYLRGGLQFVGMVRPARIAEFACQGFVVFAPYYRGNRGGEGRDEMAGDDRFDAVYAADVLKKFCSVDKIHLFGFSRGGIMALWTGILRSDIKSIVTWAGVSNVKSMYMERVDMRRTLKRIIGTSPTKDEQQYNDRNPINKIQEIDAPVLIIHGTEDTNVSIHQAYELEKALIKENKQVETWYTAGFAHQYAPQAKRQTVKALCNWMKMK